MSAPIELPGRTISAYWPIRLEPDLRPWMAGAHAAGARIVLPVVVAPDAPLVFRAWTPGCRMERGAWNIPVPADAEEHVPDVALAPLLGVDDAGYRLGNGGGHFDRTLAAFGPRVRPIGVRGTAYPRTAPGRGANWTRPTLESTGQ